MPRACQRPGAAMRRYEGARGTAFALTRSMAKNNTNREAGRKYAGSSSFTDAGQPSKAPRQDEDGRELAGSTRYAPHAVDEQSSDQGISNRPVKEEHAFPPADKSAGTPPEENAGPTTTQQGGNRGRV